MILILILYRRDTSLKLWDGFAKEELLSLGGHEGTITCVRFITDQKFDTTPPVITASSDCSIRVWNMDEGNHIISNINFAFAYFS